MNAKLTPKCAIELAIERVFEKKTQPLKLTSFDSKWEKITFFLMLFFFVVMSFIMAVRWVCDITLPYHRNIASVLVIGMVISLVLYLLSLIPLGKSILDNRVDAFNDDIVLIYRLSKNYQEHYLEYAKNSVEQEVNQLKGRIGVIVGLIEKVGVFPLGIAAYYQFVKFQDKELPIFSGNETAIFLCLFMIYLIAIRLIRVSQELEKIALILDQALSLKRTSERNTADDK